MLRRTAILPLLLVALLASACSSEATPFGPDVKTAPDDALVVVSGRLVDFTATPAPEVILLVSAWPKEAKNSDLAARATLHTISWSRADAEGNFEIRLAPDETLRSFAKENGGTVNFEITFFSGDRYPTKGVGAFGFSLPLTEEGFTPVGALGDITVFP
jgi:hypothetical protein